MLPSCPFRPARKTFTAVESFKELDEFCKKGVREGATATAAKVLRASSRQQGKPQERQGELEKDSARNGEGEAKQEGVGIFGRAVQVEE